MPHLLHPYKLVMGGDIAPVVQSNFALSANDFDSLSSTSTMPTGGSISRAGNAMLYDATGKLTYAPNNLVLQANTFDTSVGWYYGTSPGALSANTIVAPDGNTTASAYTWGTASADIGFLRLKPTGTYNASTALIYSIWVKVPSGTKRFRLRISDWSTTTVTGTNQQATTTWQRFSYAIPAGTLLNNGNIAVAFTDASGGVPDNVGPGDILHVWGPQLEAVTYQTSPSGTYYLNYPTPNTTSAYYGPRFDYDPVALQPKGLLVEGTRTNYRSYSSDFTQTSAWTKLGSCTVNNTTLLTIAPDGTNTAQAIVPVSNNSVNGIVDASGTIYLSGRTVSFYAKAGTGISTIAGQDGAGNVWTVNLSNGSSTFPSVYTYNSVTSVGNGWYRVAFNSTNASFYIGANSGANGSNYFSLWGVQVENGAFVTSFIPTVATGSIARAAETFSLTGYANRLVEAYYIDEQTGANFSGNSALSTGTVTISPPTFGWVTSLRAYTNAYAGSISSPSWLSFSRAGNAMYYDSTGTLTWAPANLALNSAFTGNTTWGFSNFTGNATTAPDGTLTAVKVLSGVGTTGAVGPNMGTFTGGIEIYSLYVKEFDSTIMSFGLYNVSTFAGLVRLTWTAGVPVLAAAGGSPTLFPPQSVGNGWYRVAFSCVGTAGNVRGVYIYPQDTSGPSCTGKGNYIWGAQIEPVTYQTAPSAYIPTTSAAVYGPRYDYDPSTVPATPRGLLIEESRANSVAPSNGTTGWNVSTMTATASSGTSPDGTNNAIQLTATGTNASFYVQYVGVTATVYTGSVWLKRISGTGQVKLINAAGARQNITITSDWARYSVTATSVSGAPFFGVELAVSGDVVQMFGAQSEVGSFATSYIPTTTASVTRAADVAQLTGSALTTLQGTQMTIAAEAVSSVATNRYLINARKISGSNYGDYYSLGSLACSLNVATVNQATLTYSPAPTTTSIFRAAFAIQANNFAAVANNGTVQTDGTGSIVTGIDQGWLGGYSDGVYLNGYVRSMALYNQRLPDAILKQKSSVNAPY